VTGSSEGEYARYENNSSGFGFLEEGKEALRKFRRPEEMHFEYAAKFVRSKIPKLYPWIASGIVNEDIHLFPPALDLSNEVVDFGRDSQVPRDEETTSAPALDIGQEFFRLGAMSMEVDGYLRAFFGQSSGRGSTDPPRSPRDQRAHGRG
jgi:hypothetical protein